MHDFILVYALNGCAHPRFNGSGLGLPMSDFFLLLVYVDQSPSTARADLMNRCPSMCAGIWLVEFDRTSETALNELHWLMFVFHCWPFALAITGPMRERIHSGDSPAFE